MKRFLMSLVFTFVLGIPVGVYAGEMLEIKGSDTLINLVQKLSEEYMKANPGKYVSVTGGGSGTGIAALINNKTDIADSSRSIKPSEIEQALGRNIPVTQVVVAIDGLSIIVNPQNSVSQLTTEEIGRIFRGEVTNWKEIGGNDMPITLYGRQSNSGTYTFMQEEILKGDYSSKMNQMNGNAQIVEAVKNDPSGIGYSGVGYVKNATGITILSVAKKTGGEYASPLLASNITSGKYPIMRPLYQYVNGKSKNGYLKEFIAFELSSPGQKIVDDEGFFPIFDEYKELNKKNGYSGS